MLGATLTTAATPQAASASALTRSRSTWSMIAMSPGSQPLGELLGLPVETRDAGDAAASAVDRAPAQPAKPRHAQARASVLIFGERSFIVMPSCQSADV